MEVTSLKLLEMEKSISLDALLSSDKLLVAKEHGTKKNKLGSDLNRDNFDKKDFNEGDVDIEVESPKTIINEDIHLKEVENQIKQENEINVLDVSASITINEIQDNWKNFIDKLHMKKPSVASIMENSVPVKFENGKITIEIASSLEFHINMIDKNYDLVKNILNDQFNIDLDFIIEKKSESHANENQIQDGLDTSNYQDNDQLRNKIVDLFDGEILT
tara:strand:- start:24 stop:677 length:654 start_codon:yes stop_codon:yes gene_type:complete